LEENYLKKLDDINVNLLKATNGQETIGLQHAFMKYVELDRKCHSDKHVERLKTHIQQLNQFKVPGH
jgi:predicted metal-dependent HD superfamily phosphohydrolase